MHIRNYMDEQCWTSDGARLAFLAETRRDVRRFVSQSSLTGAGMGAQFQDLIISSPNVRRLVRGETEPVDAGQAFIDERAFLRVLGIQLPGAPALASASDVDHVDGLDAGSNV